MSDNIKTCHQCGKPATKQCIRCREENLVPARFCSNECQKLNWPKHKKWHRLHQSIREKQESYEKQMGFDPKKAATDMVKLQNEATSKYVKKCSEASAMLMEYKAKDAEKLLLQAVKMNPEECPAYSLLAIAYKQSDKVDLSAEAHLNVMKYSKPGSPEWALAFNRAHSCFTSGYSFSPGK
eukprot:Pgem_evm1s4357